MDALRLLSRGTSLRARPTTGSTPQPLPSEGGQHLSNGNGESKKRKRSDDDASILLSTEGVRELQSKHKIRIVDLRKLHRSSSSKTKKQQKESARMFPQPLASFQQLASQHAISPAIRRNITEQAYYEPSEVQIAALPVLLTDPEAEPNLLTVAPTGSGKTLAFLIPTIEKIRKQHSVSKDRYARAIILAPTKELVGQIVNEGRKLCANTGVTITAMRKGMKLHDADQSVQDESSGSEEDADDEQKDQTSAMTVKTDILVSTPLAIANALESNTLPNIASLILDEADVLLDPLFRSQTLSTWSACTSSSLRVSLWSATIGSNIEELAISTITARRKRLSLKTKAPLYRIVIGLKDTSLPNITHKLIYAATEPGKLLGLRQLLHPSRPVSSAPNTKDFVADAPLRPPFLVFTQTITRASALFAELQYDIPPSTTTPPTPRIALLHAALPTHVRSNIMTNFRAGKIWILITTDLLSRGVDFRGVNGVVNYDIPTTTASYIHRAGRTGRAGRSGGVCVTLYTKEDVKYLRGIVGVIKSSSPSTTAAASATSNEINGIEPWLLHALPTVTKKDRKELKQRGVETRRAIKESDDAEERKRKRKSRVGTQSGWEKQVEDRKRGAVQGSLARKRRVEEEENGGGSDVEAGEDGFEGFD